jgi:hypothetical protein
MNDKCYYSLEDKYFAQQKLNRDLISVICVLAAENAQLTTRVDAQVKIIDTLNNTIDARNLALDRITGV